MKKSILTAMPVYTATPNPKPFSVKCVHLGDETIKIHYAGTEAMPLTVRQIKWHVVTGKDSICSYSIIKGICQCSALSSPLTRQGSRETRCKLHASPAALHWTARMRVLFNPQVWATGRGRFKDTRCFFSDCHSYFHTRRLVQTRGSGRRWSWLQQEMNYGFVCSINCISG